MKSQITIYIDEELMKVIKETATQQHRSLSNTISSMLKDSIKPQETKQ